MQKEKMMVTLLVAIHVTMFMIMAGEIIRVSITRNYSGLLFPFLFIWLWITNYATMFEKLKEKRIFVVLKDKDW